MEKETALFEAYIRQELPPEERRDLEARFEAEPELKRTFLLYRQLRSTISANQRAERGAEALRPQLAALGEQYIPARKAKISAIPRRLIPVIGLAASVLLLVLAYTAGLFEGNDDPQLSLEEYYAPRPVPLRLDNEGPTAYRDFYLAFQQKEYQRAIALTDSLPTSEPELQLFLGYCYLRTDAFDRAIDTFKQIVQDGDSRYRDNAEWHLLLCYLEKEETSKATNLLRELRDDPAHDFYDAAQELSLPVPD